MQTLKEEVQAYWNQKPCEAEDWSNQALSLEYFKGIARHRYATHPYIPAFAEFERWRGRKVLEIGVGAGSDFCRWVEAGAEAVGVDLTPNGVRLTLTNMALRGLQAEVLQADSENLPFSDAQFDLCYSFGVIHHTPDIEKAVSEIKRVVKPGGEIRIMLYHMRSWVTLRTYLEHALLRGKIFLPPEKCLALGKESPGTKAYTRRQVMEMFQDFSAVKVWPQLTTYDVWEEAQRVGLHWKMAHALWPGWAVVRLGNRFGWNLLIAGVRK